MKTLASWISWFILDSSLVRLLCAWKFESINYRSSSFTFHHSLLFTMFFGKKSFDVKRIYYSTDFSLDAEASLKKVETQRFSFVGKWKNLVNGEKYESHKGKQKRTKIFKWHHQREGKCLLWTFEKPLTFYAFVNTIITMFLFIHIHPLMFVTYRRLWMLDDWKMRLQRVKAVGKERPGRSIEWSSCIFIWSKFITESSCNEKTQLKITMVLWQRDYQCNMLFVYVKGNENSKLICAVCK